MVVVYVMLLATRETKFNISKRTGKRECLTLLHSLSLTYTHTLSLLLLSLIHKTNALTLSLTLPHTLSCPPSLSLSLSRPPTDSFALTFQVNILLTKSLFSQCLVKCTRDENNCTRQNKGMQCRHYYDSR